jgi:hypothetical protein
MVVRGVDTWACARGARFSPGFNILGFQPGWIRECSIGKSFRGLSFFKIMPLLTELEAVLGWVLQRCRSSGPAERLRDGLGMRAVTDVDGGMVVSWERNGREGGI